MRSREDVGRDGAFRCPPGSDQPRLQPFPGPAVVTVDGMDAVAVCESVLLVHRGRAASSSRAREPITSGCRLIDDRWQIVGTDDANSGRQIARHAICWLRGSPVHERTTRRQGRPGDRRGRGHRRGHRPALRRRGREGRGRRDRLGCRRSRRAIDRRNVCIAPTCPIAVRSRMPCRPLCRRTGRSTSWSTTPGAAAGSAGSRRRPTNSCRRASPSATTARSGRCARRSDT